MTTTNRTKNNKSLMKGSCRLGKESVLGISELLGTYQRPFDSEQYRSLEKEGQGFPEPQLSLILCALKSGNKQHLQDSVFALYQQYLRMPPRLGSRLSQRSQFFESLQQRLKSSGVTVGKSLLKRCLDNGLRCSNAI